MVPGNFFYGDLANTTLGTFTADVATDVLTCSAPHGLDENDYVVVKSSGTLPGGLNVNYAYTAYQVTATTLKLRTADFGRERPSLSLRPVQNITSAGTGTHTIMSPGIFQGEWFDLRDYPNWWLLCYYITATPITRVDLVVATNEPGTEFLPTPFRRYISGNNGRAFDIVGGGLGIVSDNGTQSEISGVSMPGPSLFIGPYGRLEVVNGSFDQSNSINFAAVQASRGGARVNPNYNILSVPHVASAGHIVAATPETFAALYPGNPTPGNLITRSGNNALHVSLRDVHGDASIQLEALDSFSTSQSNVGATAVQIVGSPLTGRRTVLVKNLSSSSKSIFIGTSSAVTSSNGYELAAGEGVALDLKSTGTGIWAISGSGTQRASWLEIA